MEDMRTELDKEEEAWNEDFKKREEELVELRAKLDSLNAEAAKEGGNDEASGKKTRSRRERDGEDEEDDRETSLPGRAPLPDRDADEAMDEGDSTNPYKADATADSSMAGVAEGEDVVACKWAEWFRRLLLTDVCLNPQIKGIETCTTRQNLDNMLLHLLLTSVKSMAPFSDSARYLHNPH
jgi:hypothetical protein